MVIHLECTNLKVTFCESFCFLHLTAQEVFKILEKDKELVSYLVQEFPWTDLVQLLQCPCMYIFIYICPLEQDFLASGLMCRKSVIKSQRMVPQREGGSNYVYLLLLKIPLATTAMGRKGDIMGYILAWPYGTKNKHFSRQV